MNPIINIIARRFAVCGALFASVLPAMSFAARPTGITVTKPKAVNAAPVASDQSLQVKPGRWLSIFMQGTDPESAPLTFEVVTQPEHGTLSEGFIVWAMNGTGAPPPKIAAPIAVGEPTPSVDYSSPFRSYVSNDGYEGTDSFTFRVSDGKNYSNVATVSINVTSANRAPEASDVQDQNKRGSKTFLYLPTSDPDNDPTTVVIKTQPLHGSLHLATDEDFGFAIPLTSGPIAIDGLDNGSVGGTVSNTAACCCPILMRPYVYEQAPLADGETPATEDSFTFVADDGTDQSAPATVTLKLLPPNLPPVVKIGVDAGVDAWTTTTSTVVVAQANGTAPVKLDTTDSIDPDGDSAYLWTSWSEATSSATEDFAWGSEVFQDLPVGKHSITATVNDPEGASTKGTVLVEVLSPADAVTRLQNDLAATPSTASAKVKTALANTLKAAHDAFAKKKALTGVAKLNEFKKNVKPQLGKNAAKKATVLVSTTQQIIDGSTGKSSPKPVIAPAVR